MGTADQWVDDNVVSPIADSAAGQWVASSVDEFNALTTSGADWVRSKWNSDLADQIRECMAWVGREAWNSIPFPMRMNIEAMIGCGKVLWGYGEGVVSLVEAGMSGYSALTYADWAAMGDWIAREVAADPAGFDTANQYLKAAKDFAADVDTEFMEQAVGNIIVKYDLNSRRILIVNSRDREIRTFYKADSRSDDPWSDALALAADLTNGNG